MNSLFNPHIISYRKIAPNWFGANFFLFKYIYLLSKNQTNNNSNLLSLLKKKAIVLKNIS